MPLLTLVAAVSFACPNPAHPDGASIRCAESAQVQQLHGIAVPPVRAPCTGYRSCPPDPGNAARDHLAELTRGLTVTCTRTGKTSDGAPEARCYAAGLDLSCAMVVDGFATPTDPGLGCKPGAGSRSADVVMKREARNFAALPLLWRWVPLVLIIINLVTFLAFRLDKSRLQRGLNRVSELHLLFLTLIGGTVGAIIAQVQLDHKHDEQPFATQFMLLVGAQIGVAVGFLALRFLPI